VVYPTLEQLLLQPSKKELLLVKRSVLSMISGVITFCVAVTIVVLAHLYFPAIGWIPVVRHFSPRWLALIPFVILLELTRRYHDNLYIFGESNVTRRQGRFSLRYSLPTIRYRDIRGITVYQTFWGRVFGYGDVLLGTAARADSELIIEMVDAPYDLADLIEQFRRHNLDEDSEPERDDAI
jgi:PII-like signaling protein